MLGDNPIPFQKWKQRDLKLGGPAPEASGLPMGHCASISFINYVTQRGEEGLPWF